MDLDPGSPKHMDSTDPALVRNTALFIEQLYRAGELDGRAGPLSPSPPPLHSTRQDPGWRRQPEPHGAAPRPSGGRQGRVGKKPGFF